MMTLYNNVDEASILGSTIIRFKLFLVLFRVMTKFGELT